MTSKIKRRVASFALFAAAGVLAAACSADPQEQDESTTEALTDNAAVKIMKWQDPDAIHAEAAPAGAKLVYHGGRVVSNIQIVQVLYGSGSFLSQVSSTSTTAGASMGAFYRDVSASAYFNWLTEYNTPASGGTNQKIGHGTFLRQVRITPAASRNGTTITDAQIQAELSAQIKAGTLPAPTHDAQGNNNTYYAVFFPHGKKISLGGTPSCQAGGFCAYHGTVANAGGKGEIYYGVHPDMQAGSGCDVGCGGGSNFQNQQSVSSHEMIETVTDAEVGLATVIGPPLAWYDSTNGEIGDICNAQQGSISANGFTYTVQKEFSNVAKNCIVTR